MRFSRIIQSQAHGHCGPTSLSSCLAVLGMEVSPRKLARAAGKSLLQVLDGGIDEHDLRRAASRHGGACRQLLVRRRAAAPSFAKRLASHLQRGEPAVLLVGDFDHWVAVLGFRADSGHYLVMDPNDDERAISTWRERHLLGRAWNEDDDEDGESQYFALLVTRRDGGRPGGSPPSSSHYANAGPYRQRVRWRRTSRGLRGARARGAGPGANRSPESSGSSRMRSSRRWTSGRTTAL